MGRMTGPELHRAVRGYCARTGTTLDALANLAKVSRSIVDRLGDRAFPNGGTVDRLTSAMAAFPDGIARQRAAGPGDPDGGAAALAAAIARTAVVLPRPAPPETLADSVRCEVEAVSRRRRQAYADGGDPLPLLRAPRCGPAETASAMIRTVQRRAPVLWARVREQASEAGTMPGALLIELVERGLGEGA